MHPHEYGAERAIDPLYLSVKNSAAAIDSSHVTLIFRLAISMQEHPLYACA